MNAINKVIVALIFTISLTNLCSAQWIQTSIPIDFLVSDMEIYKEELYAVVGYKVIKFQEDGISFEVLTDNHEFQFSLASSKDFLFAGNNRFNFSTRYGVLRSVEGDTTWTRFENQLPNTTIFSLSAKDNLIAAGGAFGVYASWDDGINWTRTLQYPGFGYFNTPIFLSDDVILVGGQDLVNISFDTMRTWTNTELGGQVRAFLEKDNLYYLITGTNVYKSIDKGVSWELLNNGLLESVPLTAIIDYTEDSIMVAAGGRIFTLKNGENSWSLYDSPDFEVDKIIVFNNAIWAAGREGIWKKEIDNLVSSNEIHFSPSIQFQLSPNPFQNFLNIKQEATSISNFTISFFDMSGKQVKSVTLKNSNQQISTAHLANGLYFYRIINANGRMIANGKVIKH